MLQQLAHLAHCRPPSPQLVAAADLEQLLLHLLDRCFSPLLVRIHFCSKPLKIIASPSTHMNVAEEDRQVNMESLVCLGKLTIRFVGCCRSPLAFQFPVVLPLVPPVPLRHLCQRLSESSNVFICVFLFLPLPKRAP